MIDIHSHILPNVDDGSVDMEMSLGMARQYIENNIYKVIATPHFIEKNISLDMENNKLVQRLLQDELNNHKIPLQVLLGNEIYLSTTIIKDIEDGKASTLNKSKYILIELPMNDIPMYFDSIIYEILIKGWIPIWAHPERNLKVIENPNILYRYIKKGGLVQINLPSLMGSYGKNVKTTAIKLLNHSMVHFAGTDSHTNRSRSPNVANALKVLRDTIPASYFNQIVEENAMLLLNNKDIPILEPLEVKENMSIFKYIKSKYFKNQI